MQITIPVSIGELYDKLTILEIKKNKIVDKKKLSNIVSEYNMLHEIAISVAPDYQSQVLYRNLQLVNLSLWDIEERKRAHETEKRFDREFITLARSVYIYNDSRARIKKQIDIETNSFLTEEKSY